MSTNKMYSGFKGMNRQSDIANMSDKYLYDIYNGYIGKDTGIYKRFGYSKKYATAVQESEADVDILAYYEAVYDDTSNDYFVCTADHIYVWNAGGSSWTDLHTNTASCTFVSIVQYGDDIVFADGVNTPQIFTKGGATTSDLTMPAAASTFKYLLVHNNRLWGISDDNIAYYSKLGDIDDWTTAGDAGAGYLGLINYITKGDELVSMSTFSKAYISFFMKEHVLTYNIGTVASDFTLLQTTVGTGVKSKQATISFGDDLYYIDNDSPKSFKASLSSQELDVNDITEGIMGNYYRDLIYAVSNDRISITKFAKRSWLLMHIPIGENGEILVWDYAYKMWAGRWRLQHKVNSMFEDLNGDLCFASTGYIYKFDTTTYNDLTTAIDFIVQTPFYYGTKPYHIERIPYLEFSAYTESSDTTLAVSLYYEYEDTTSTYELVTLANPAYFWDDCYWDDSYWDSSGQDFYRVIALGKGKMHRLVFRNNQASKDVKIDNYRIYLKQLGKN